MVTAPVNRVIPFSSVDGPGSRTAVFLQGCNINCQYCHNPETRNHCIGCGACVAVCPNGALKKADSGEILYNWKQCVFCDSCIQVCKHGSSPRIRSMEAADVMKEIRRQMPFIRGVTVSGGECMLHADWILELFSLCKKEGLHTLIDSNGTIPFWDYPALMQVTDGVMLDMKAYDTADYTRVTGGNNEIVCKNLDWLAQNDKLWEVRTVIVPGLFDTKQTVTETAKRIAQVQNRDNHAHVIEYKLITYREAGVRMQYRLYPSPSREEIEQLATLAEQIFAQNGQGNPVIRI